MRYLIIGLGIYGTNLALDLTDMGNEVIGADINQANVEAIKDNISSVYLVDSTEEAALNVLPLKGVDAVIVAIGEHFGASIRTVALLKKYGVKTIFARAIDSLHESILDSFHIARILKPEQEAAQILSSELQLGCDVAVMNIDANSAILRFQAPDVLVGMAYDRLNLEEHYHLHLVTATRKLPRKNIMGVEQSVAQTMDLTEEGLTVENGDTIVCFGTLKDFRNFYKHL